MSLTNSFLSAVGFSVVLTAVSNTGIAQEPPRPIRVGLFVLRRRSTRAMIVDLSRDYATMVTLRQEPHGGAALRQPRHAADFWLRAGVREKQARCNRYCLYP